jgi:hypothetical protein
MREQQKTVLQRIRFDFREDVPLGIEQQPQCSAAGLQRADVAGSDRVQIARPVRACQLEYGVIVGVKESHRFACARPLFFQRRICGGQLHAEIIAEGGAQCRVLRMEGALHRLLV